MVFFELHRHANPESRQKIASVIERLSGFWSTMDRPTLIRHEVEALLDQQIGPVESPLSSEKYCSWGLSFAQRPESPPFVHLRQLLNSGAIDMSDVDPGFRGEMLSYHRQCFAGPATEVEELKWRNAGWRPERSDELFADRVTLHRETQASLDSEPRWRKGRIRDVISKDELMVDLQWAIGASLKARGKSWEYLWE